MGFLHLTPNKSFTLFVVYRVVWGLPLAALYVLA